MYKGKQICAGCKKPGSERNRPKKDDLCYSCQIVYNKGLAECAHQSIQYVRVFQHYHAFRSDRVNDLAHKVLAALHNPHVKTTAGTKRLKAAFGDNGKWYYIRESLFSPLQEFFTDLSEEINDFESEVESLPNKAREEVSKERDRVFNEGVEKGKNLLFMLESGEISMNDFAKRLKYHV